jgi:hypothetical protein
LAGINWWHIWTRCDTRLSLKLIAKPQNLTAITLLEVEPGSGETVAKNLALDLTLNNLSVDVGNQVIGCDNTSKD